MYPPTPAHLSGAEGDTLHGLGHLGTHPLLLVSQPRQRLQQHEGGNTGDTSEAGTFSMILEHMLLG